jgi:DNA polymerase III subunit chi
VSLGIDQRLMTQVQFHLLATSGDDARLRHACTLVEQAQQQDQHVFIRGNDADLRRLDELLWTFHDHAFIPHEAAAPTAPSHLRVVALLGLDQTLPVNFTTVINLSDDFPPQLDAAEVIHEIVDADPARKQQARDRYKQYRDKGCTLETKNW